MSIRARQRQRTSQNTSTGRERVGKIRQAKTSRNQKIATREAAMQLVKLLVDQMDKAQLKELFDYVDETYWDKQFETVPDALLQMAERAAAEEKAGLTVQLAPKKT